MENRFTIEHALRQTSSSNSGTPVPPPPPPHPDYMVRIPSGGSLTPVPAYNNHNKAELDGKDGQNSSKNFDDSSISSFSKINANSVEFPWIPSYLYCTAYGERFQNFAAAVGAHHDGGEYNNNNRKPASNDKSPNTSNDHYERDISPTRFSLPQIFPSRSSAEVNVLRNGTTTNKFGTENGGANDNSNNNNNNASSAAIKPRKEIGIPPLPTMWSTKDRTVSSSKVTSNGYNITVSVDPKGDEKQCCALKTNYSIPKLCGIYYYEVKVIETGANDCISIGLCDADASLNKMPGQDNPSWGYHGDDGRIMACQGTSKDFGPRYGAGDTIGCGVNFRKNSIFYTKNGLLLGTAFRDVNGTQFYPSIGLRDGQTVATNFGSQDFRFDIEKFIRDEKSKVLDEIVGQGESNTKQQNLASGMENEDKTEFIQQLVASYFSHVGFLDTAKEFERERNIPVELNQQQQQSIMDMDIDQEYSNSNSNDRSEDEIEGVERQKIRDLILQANMDSALEHMQNIFPSVLANNDLIHFKLRCRKFVELFKKSIQINDDITMGNNENVDKQQEEDDNLNEVIQYGEELRKDYKDDTRLYVKETLRNIFSLYAYPDAESIANDDKVSRLLEREQLVPLADEVNSEILVSQGKPSVPSLQRLAQHATQLVWELSDRGVDSANLINVKDDFLE